MGKHRNSTEILLNIYAIQPVMRGSDTYTETFERLKKFSELQVELCEALVCEVQDGKHG